MQESGWYRDKFRPLQFLGIVRDFLFIKMIYRRKQNEFSRNETTI